ncbi:uncharacterized protein LOC142335333 isoform X2 [Convolutriloba macropyga]
MGHDREQITVHSRKTSLGESIDDLKRHNNSRKLHGSQKCVSQYSATEDITEEENGFAISPDFEGGVELLSVANKSDELLQNLILMAKQMAGSIDTKYKLKVNKKPVLKDHLVACAALRKYFISGPCTGKPPMNPLTKSIWKKWKEFSEESKLVSGNRMKEILVEHAEAAMQIFDTDPDFRVLMQKNESIKDFKKLLEEFKQSLQEASTSSARPSFEHRPEKATAVDDVDTFLHTFSHMQAQVTKSYLELMESLKVRWARSGDDVMSRENVAKKTREDLLSIQDQLVKYQNSLIMYQSDINALWQCMIQHQQMMNNDFQWDFVESVNGDDVRGVENGYTKKQKAFHKRVSRFFTKKLGKSKKK